jgi:hypothetical protein
MGDQHTVPAEAYAPDPGRADPDSSDLMPAWAAQLIALLILFLLQHSLARQQRRARRLASKPVGPPAQPRDSTQTPATSTDSQSDDATARPRRGRGVAPECPELPDALKALLDRLQQCDGGPSLWSQLQALLNVPSMIDPDTAATPTEPPPSPLCVAKLCCHQRRFGRASLQHAVVPTPWRQTLIRAGTGPPTGPPGASAYQFHDA